MSESPAVQAPNPLGESEFPVLVLNVRDEVSSPPRLGHRQMHWHDDVQFLVVLEGPVVVDCAGEHVSCAAGEATFFNAGIAHRVMGGEGTLYTSFVFPPKLLGFFAGSEMAATSVAPYVGPLAQPFARFDGSEPWHRELVSELTCARELLLEKDASAADRYRACAHLVTAWAIYVQHTRLVAPPASRRLDNERIKVLTDYIEGHYGEKISLDDIARAASLSKAECARCFRRMLQTTPGAYLRDLRIAHAMELMQNTGLDLACVARATGFSSASYFSSAFKARTGLSPRAWIDACGTDAFRREMR